MPDTGGENMQELKEVQIALARIEESLKPLAMLPTAVSEIKDTSRDARYAASQAAQDIQAMKTVLDVTKVTADDARRISADAIRRLDEQEENTKWLKRAFYGVFITAAAGGICTLIITAINVG